MKTELGLHHELWHEQCWFQKQCQQLESLYWQWMLDKLMASDPFCHSGDRCHWLQDYHDQLHVLCSYTRSRQGCHMVWRNAECLYTVSWPGVTWCTDSSSYCLVTADLVLRLASKSQALLITCAKVGLVRFSWEKRSLLKCLMVSLRPTTKMSLYSLPSTADGKLHHFWYSSLTTVGDCWMLIPGSCFKRQGKLWVDCMTVSFPS